jgi:hypothetical protein
MTFITWWMAVPLRAVSWTVAVGVLVPLVGSKSTEREFDFRRTTPPASNRTLRSACASPWHTAAPLAVQLHWLAAPVWIT